MKKIGYTKFALGLFFFNSLIVISGCSQGVKLSGEQQFIEQQKDSEHLQSLALDLSLKTAILQNVYSNGHFQPKDCSIIADESVPIIQVSDSERGSCVTWDFVPTDSGYFRIINRETEGFIRAQGCSRTRREIEIRQVSRRFSGRCTQWKFLHIGNGQYRIINRVSGNFIRSSRCQIAKDSKIPLMQVSNRHTGRCTLWRLVSPVSDDVMTEEVPGLADPSLLKDSDPISVTKDNTVIQNLNFTANSTQSHIEIANGVKGTVIRNCRFENASAGHPNYLDGGAIRVNDGADVVVVNSEFHDNFRAVRAHKAEGVQVLFSKATGSMRNFIELNQSNNSSFQNVIAYNVVQWNQGFFSVKDFNDLPAKINWNNRGETELFPEDGISIYSTNGTEEKPTLILGNFFTTANRNWDFTGSFGATVTAGDGPTGSPGNYTEIQANLSWNFTMNGFSINGGKGHTLYDNVVYADGREKQYWEDPSDPYTALIRNVAYLHDNWLNNIPIEAASANNLAFYYNPWGIPHGFYNTIDGSPHPNGNDPWSYELTSAELNWDGEKEGSIVDRWENRQQTIDSIVRLYGKFRADL